MAITASLIFFIDLLIKSYLKNNFPFQSIPIIRNIFHITVVFNKGAAFGLLRGYNTFLTYSSIILIVFLLNMIRKERPKTFIDKLMLGLILGGAFSNLYDRFFYGFVVDYIDLRVWPVFNLSDMGISIGVIILILRIFQKNETVRNN